MLSARAATPIVVALMLAEMPLTAASLPVSKPEQVGLSTERLLRIGEMVQRCIDAHEMSGAVTLVARRGRIAHLEAQGLMDLESRKSMPKDGLFWIASMSKPVTATAILMLLEEGKVRLNDPVAKFIPEFRGMKVATIPERPVGTGAPPFYTIPATREITIQDLLTHVSGLVSGGPVSTAEQQKSTSKQAKNSPIIFRALRPHRSISNPVRAGATARPPDSRLSAAWLRSSRVRLSIDSCNSGFSNLSA